MTTPTTNKMIKLLSNRHQTDVCVAECKTGPTYFADMQKIDFWIEKKSWKRPLSIAYEIKLSRQDFVNDKKWMGYLPYCNEFYFVCPYKMINKSEIPDVAGLLWATKNFTRLYTIKKAPYRQIDVPNEMYRYILYCRARITREHEHANKKEIWKDWLKDKKIDRKFGYHVGKTLREEIDKKIKDVESENEKLKKSIESCDEIIKLLKSFGLSIKDCYMLSWKFEKKLEEFKYRYSPETITLLENTINNLRSIIDFLKLKEKDDSE